MPFTRRALLQSAAASFALPGFGVAPLQPRPSTEVARPIHLAVSTYSYWHFRTEKYPVEKVIDEAARLGFDGVEILHRQMADESPAYVNRLKQQAFRLGVALPMLSIHQDFVTPDPAERKKDIDHTRRCIDLAARLGIPAIRLNSGRWNTIPSFDDLMKVKGASRRSRATRTRRPSSGSSNRFTRAFPRPSRRACCSRSRTTGG